MDLVGDGDVTDVGSVDLSGVVVRRNIQFITMFRSKKTRIFT